MPQFIERRDGDRFRFAAPQHDCRLSAAILDSTSIVATR
jgi:hypothetical protein